MPIFLVGERTAERARERGFLGQAIVAANATELAARFGMLAQRPRTLVYLAGVDRKTDVEIALEIAGQDAAVVEVYEARAGATLTDEADAALRSGSLDAVLHYSRRSATLFCELTGARGLDISRLRHLCLSDDVAAPLRGYGLPLVDVAGAPNEAALLGLLDQA